MLALFGISFFSFILFKPLILTIESDVFHLTDIYIFIGFFLAFLIIGLILPCIFFIKIENFIWNFFKFQIMYDDENLKNAIKEAQKIGTNME